MQTKTRPNILFVLVDQMRFPPHSPSGDLAALNQILRFTPGDITDNPYARYFPGFVRLRRNAVSLQNHTIASSACVPSRSAIMTGQYSARSGVSQTEGMFKIDTDPAFPWLPSDGVPTLGDWFRAAGYQTHYFGRWDLSNPPVGSLESWGFADWEYSYPSDQRFGTPNLGIYRDIGYTDLVRTFLNRKALGVQADIINSNNATNASFKQQPWLAVASFVNPHDIGAYPFPWQPNVQPRPDGQPPGIHPFGAPPQGTRSNPPVYGNVPATYRVPLNPDGFAMPPVPLPANWRADLAHKPDCQYDYSYKFPIALTTLRGQNALGPSPYPFQMQDNAADWYRGYLEFYLYLQYRVNLQIDEILRCLDENGLAENTIVVFTSDHGELAGAHGGQLEKWHNAYQESIHVPAVVSSPFLDLNGGMRAVTTHTSHVDWVPTLLGLAGYDANDRAAMARFIQGHTVKPLPGVDLSGLIADGIEPQRDGVLFVSDDNITAPLDTNYIQDRYRWYLQETANLTAPDGQPTAQQPLRAPGPVVQPNHVQCYFEQPWKLARYWDPGNASNTQWELYNLAVDPSENINLLSWDSATGAPVLRSEAVQALGLDLAATASTLTRLRSALDRELLHAGYNPRSAQQLGYVADGVPPGPLG
jgi:arylsulfatase A-like enzyme